VAPSPAAPAAPAAPPVAPRRTHIAAEPSARLDAVAPAARPAPGPIATRADRDATTATLAEEARLLALGLRQLRNDGDAEAALVTFAAYLRRFPDGALAPEADIGRVEALIALDRYDDALAILDGLPETRQVVRGRELASLRGELRARAGRCAEAEADFARVLRQSLGDGAEERALIGRANCRSRSGDVAGARADLAAYLQRFPDGRFATETRRALGP
jgi:TolA-binding protein